MQKEVGIYAIKNLQNSKMYVGQSVNIVVRWRDHLKKLRANTHIAKYLQRSFDKYGENSFVFGVIEYCNREELNEKEYYWVNFYDTYNKGYNQTVPNPRTGKRTFTKEDKLKHKLIGKNQWTKLPKKIKQERIDFLNSIKPAPITKHVSLYNKGTFEKIIEFNSFRECSEYFNVPYDRISTVLIKLFNFERITYKGYIFIKEGDSIEAWKERKQAHDLQVIANITEYKSLRNFNAAPKRGPLSVEELYLSRTKNAKIASQALRNMQNKVLQIWDKEENLIDTVLTQKDAEKITGVPSKYIDKVLRKEKKSYRGYIFKYIPRTGEYSHLI